MIENMTVKEICDQYRPETLTEKILHENLCIYRDTIEHFSRLYEEETFPRSRISDLLEE